MSKQGPSSNAKDKKDSAETASLQSQAARTSKKKFSMNLMSMFQRSKAKSAEKSSTTSERSTSSKSSRSSRSGQGFSQGSDIETQLKRKAYKVEEINNFIASLKADTSLGTLPVDAAFTQIMSSQSFAIFKNKISGIVADEHRKWTKNEASIKVAEKYLQQAEVTERMLRRLKAKPRRTQGRNQKKDDAHFVHKRSMFYQRELGRLYGKCLLLISRKSKEKLQEEMFKKAYQGLARLHGGGEAMPDLSNIECPRVLLGIAYTCLQKMQKLKHAYHKLLADELFQFECDKQQQALAYGKLQKLMKYVEEVMEKGKKDKQFQAKIVSIEQKLRENIPEKAKVVGSRPVERGERIENVILSMKTELKMKKDVLKKDDLIFSEYPWALHYLGRRCPSCWRSLRTSVVWPCDQCAEVFYCNKECVANHKIHKLLCTFTTFIHHTLGPIANLVYQMLISCDIYQVIKFGETSKHRDLSDKLVLHNILRAYPFVCPNDAKVNMSALSHSLVTAVLVMEHLQTSAASNIDAIKALKDGISEKHFIMAAYKLFAYLENIPVGRIPLTGTNRQDIVGFGFGSSGLFVRRSCRPNCYRVFTPDGRIEYRAANTVGVRIDELVTLECGCGCAGMEKQCSCAKCSNNN